LLLFLQHFGDTFIKVLQQMIQVLSAEMEHSGIQNMVQKHKSIAVSHTLSFGLSF
jgi:hypothetical protein